MSTPEETANQDFDDNTVTVPIHEDEICLFIYPFSEDEIEEGQAYNDCYPDVRLEIDQLTNTIDEHYVEKLILSGGHAIAVRGDSESLLSIYNELAEKVDLFFSTAGDHESSLEQYEIAAKAFADEDNEVAVIYPFDREKFSHAKLSNHFIEAIYGYYATIIQTENDADNFDTTLEKIAKPIGVNNIPSEAPLTFVYGHHEQLKTFLEQLPKNFHFEYVDQKQYEDMVADFLLNDPYTLYFMPPGTTYS